MPKAPIVSPEQAVSCIESGHRVFVQGAAATPEELIDALVGQADRLKGVELIHIHTDGKAAYTQEQYEGVFKTNACFVGANVRAAIPTGRADYIPVFLSEIGALFREGVLPVDVALIHVSPPDKHGYCSLGTSVDVALPAVENARYVVAQINPQVPRAHGEGFVHLSRFHAAIEVDRPLFAHPAPPVGETEEKIGKFVAELVEDGATLQMGIGAVPDAALAQLHGHKDLSVHTEMFSDGLIPLVEKGVVTNKHKKVFPGKVVSCFVAGSQKVYDFLDDNPIVNLIEAAKTNDTALIRKNPKVTAINSAVEIDLTGQICADTIGGRQFSGVGGQMDFIRGASLSPDGKPIIALSSTTRRGESKIVPYLKQGAGVTTTRAHVHYVVTEYGVAYLFGKNLRQRSRELIRIAHPDHREELERIAHERFGDF